MAETVDPTSAKRGIQVIQIPVKDGQPINLYSGSHALLIGESNYQNWPDLESIPRELQQVRDVLESQGFHVIMKLDLDGAQLKQAFEDFINQYGFDRENRLLFFFTGHGHTRKNGDKGYIVPVDAPHPEIDERGFIQKAVDMELITTWARRVEANHALFLFDSCFSGTVFKAKSVPKIPKYIDKLVAKPVRQFITAGSANEMVPAKSIFTPAFVDALKEGKGDLNKDGFVTGDELGIYLVEEISKYVNQTPQYGKIREYDLAQGDFVFALANIKQSLPQISSASSSTSQQMAAIPPPQNLLNKLELKPQNKSEVIRTLQEQNPVRSIALSPNSERLAYGSADGNIKIVEFSSGKETLSWKAHKKTVLSLAFSPNGLLLASGGGDGATYIWEVSTGKLLSSLEAYDFGVSAVTFSPNGKMLAVSGGSKNFFSVYRPAIKLWDIATGNEVHTILPDAKSIYALSFRADGQVLASSQGKTITLWKVDTGEEIITLQGHAYDVRCVAFSPDGRLLVSGSDDETIKLWNANSGKEIKTLKGHSSPIWSIQFSPNGRWLVSSGGERFSSNVQKGDYMIRLWEISTGREIHHFEGHEGAISAVLFNKDGKLIISSSDDNTLKLWSVPQIQ